LVEFFKQAAKLHYGQRKKDDVKLRFQYVKENGVVMSHSCVKNECAANMKFRTLRSPCVVENAKVLISLDLQVCIMKMKKHFLKT
jgi:hypothetical protein